MSKLRTAVIGVGYLGRFHAQKHAALEYIDFVGVCDASQDRASEVAKELSCEAFTNPQDLIGKVDAVSIASTTQTHFELAKLFLNAGVHVLVEKPITAESYQAKELCEIAKAKNLKLQVGHIERFNPALHAVAHSCSFPYLGHWLHYQLLYLLRTVSLVSSSKVQFQVCHN